MTGAQGGRFDWSRAGGAEKKGTGGELSKPDLSYPE